MPDSAKWSFWLSRYTVWASYELYIILQAATVLEWFQLKTTEVSRL